MPGETDIGSIAARNELARSLRAKGRFNHAIGLYQQTVDSHLARSGPVDPQTLRSRSRLANTFF